MNQVWPSDFPAPSTDFGADQQANTIRTEMDSGTYRQRRRFSKELLICDVSWEMDDLQFQVFVAFHKFRLNLGNDWFDILLPLGGGMVVHTARFVGGKFNQSYQDVNFWNVTAQLEIQDRVTMDPDVLDFYLQIGFEEQGVQNFLNQLDALHNLIHVVYPINLN